MADFPLTILPSSGVIFSAEPPQPDLVLIPPGQLMEANQAVDIEPMYLQRVYDTGLAAYVYYTRKSTDPSDPPLGTGDTQPNNTGALDLANHAVIATV